MHFPRLSETQVTCKMLVVRLTLVLPLPLRSFPIISFLASPRMHLLQRHSPQVAAHCALIATHECASSLQVYRHHYRPCLRSHVIQLTTWRPHECASPKMPPPPQLLQQPSHRAHCSWPDSRRRFGTLGHFIYLVLGSGRDEPPRGLYSSFVRSCACP